MSEWNVTHENFHTKHSVFTAPDAHMPYVIQLHIREMKGGDKTRTRKHYIQGLQFRFSLSERVSETDRQTDRDRERQTETDRHSQRESEREGRRTRERAGERSRARAQERQAQRENRPMTALEWTIRIDQTDPVPWIHALSLCVTWCFLLYQDYLVLGIQSVAKTCNKAHFNLDCCL